MTDEELRRRRALGRDLSEEGIREVCDAAIEARARVAELEADKKRSAQLCGALWQELHDLKALPSTLRAQAAIAWSDHNLTCPAEDMSTLRTWCNADYDLRDAYLATCPKAEGEGDPYGHEPFPVPPPPQPGEGKEEGR